MLWKISLLLIICHRLSLAIRIAVINNTIFDPINTNYWLANLSNIVSRDLCICQCYAQSNCVTANYYGFYQECILFSAPLYLGHLHAMSISENTTVISLDNRSYVAVTTTYTTTSTTTSSTTTSSTTTGSTTTSSTTTSSTTTSSTTTTSTTSSSTTTSSTTTSSTTTSSTTTSSTTTSSTTTSSTTTSSTTTTSTTTVANAACNISTSYILTYTTSPTAYQKQTYTYTAVSTGMKKLEFGFKAVNSVKTWHLDDVSIIDKNASNSEKLVNGGFENGTLTGWQVLCLDNNCGTKGSNITQSDCHT
ncbi:unnamed protein product, partial [Rotaria sordida]